MKLSLLKETLAICRLEKSAPIPGWLMESAFFMVSRTFGELSFVCPQGPVPDGIQCDKNWRCLQVDGPLDLGLTGVIASLTASLAKAKVPVFVFSTYDTDYILVKGSDLRKAIGVLSGDGHVVEHFD
ncbi:MAG TPA: ACT domain-containing protein [Methanocella sp.]|nr:ACT domain-containing protein [Methanocella sp.]